jgi:MoxR-like ATPase
MSKKPPSEVGRIRVAPGEKVSLPGEDGAEDSVHVFDGESILAVHAALAAGRPLLARGEPGTGKSQLARAAAVCLGRRFLSQTVDARTEPRDLLYTVDAVGRLAQAQVLGAAGAMDAAERRRVMDVANFIHPGPLWWAFAWDSALAQAKRSGAPVPKGGGTRSAKRGVVVLIDEIDKADPSVPNGLLDALGHRQFDVPGGVKVTLEAGATPLVVITTNEERVLPDAFLRRCLVLHLGLPEGADELRAVLVARGSAHFPQLATSVLARAAELLVRDRQTMRSRELLAPGLAEYLDLLRAVKEQHAVEADQLALLEAVAKFVLRKHPPDRVL